MPTPHQPASPQPGNPAPASTPAAAPSGQTGTKSLLRKLKSLLRKLWKGLDHQVAGGLAVVAILAIVAAVWGIVAATGGGTSSSPGSGPAGSTSARGEGRGFTAQVAWTDDGFGGGSASTTLSAFTGPDSHIHDGQYPLGESLTVVCQTPHGRPIPVGRDYKGPDPTSTTWYRLDNGAWVPAVYVHVDQQHALPACS